MAILTGLSGERYEFTHLPWVGTIPLNAGVLVLAKGSSRTPRPVLIVLANSLLTEFHAQRREAIKQGASLLLARIERNQEKRLAMHADLLAAFPSLAERTMRSIR